MRRTVPLFLAFLLLASCRNDDAGLISASRRVFGTLPPPAPAKGDTPALVSLGRTLYFSKDLSANRTQSCDSCHPVENGRPGADDRVTSNGAMGSAGRRNSPTVLNADLHAAMFWDGRARTLEEQAQGPVLNPVEMAMPNGNAVTERLRAMDPNVFRAAFPADPNPWDLDHAARAIAAYERTLRTHDRFDDFQNGNARALTSLEKQGLRRFMSLGCTSCHNRATVGARLYQKIGIVHPYPTTDHGRFEVTKNSDDDFVFKVPSLRNVALTAPYFHDGSAKDLPTAVEKMAWHQLGMKIKPEDRDAIVAFLKTLSDTSRAER